MCPGLAAALRPLALACLPTPVEELSGLGRRGLWVKRDDLSSPLYGGNKVRKLEFLLGAARASGARTVLTMGASGSNHLLATALHGLELGLRTAGVVFPQPDSPAVREKARAYRGARVELFRTPSKYLLPWAVAAALARLRLREGRFPALIPGGGSSPLGALGFVNAGLELAEQVRAGALPAPEAVFVAYGTGGTAAGLALGLQLGGLSSRVVAVRVIDRLMANRPRLARLAAATARLLRQHAPGLDLPRAPLGALEIRPDQLGRGYGHPTPAAEEARDAFAGVGLGLELTYTAKAAAAFLGAARRTTGPLLFWLTHSAADIGRWLAAGGGEVPA